VDVDYEPLPSIADFTKAHGCDVVVHEAYPDNVAGGLAGAPPDEEIFARSAYVVKEDIYQQIYAPVPIETRGMVVECAAAAQITHHLGVHAEPARAAGVLRTPPRDPGTAGPGHHARHRRRLRPEGRPDALREDMCIVLAARKVPAALKWIEDRRENLMSAGQARHVSDSGRIAFDDDGTILAADIDFTQDVGAYPAP
jgi:carbon-monoxide dehydrogenase large subunit